MPEDELQRHEHGDDGAEGDDGPREPAMVRVAPAHAQVRAGRHDEGQEGRSDAAGQLEDRSEVMQEQ